MELGDVIGLAGVPLVVGLVQILKPFVPDARFYPLAALVLGVALNVAGAAVFGLDVPRAVFAGLVAGLAASGLYSQGRALMGVAQ